MTFIFKFSKYDYLQYDNNFKKIVIFKIQNMTNKKTNDALPTELT